MTAGANGRADAAEAAPVVFSPADHVFAGLDMRDADPPDGADVAMTLPITPRVTNPRGGLQGGLLATLIDVVAGRAAGETLGDEQSVATADMNIHYLSAVTAGPAYAWARVLRRGRSLVVVHVEVRDQGRDVLAAVATLSFAYLPLRPGQQVRAGRGAFPRQESHGA